MLTLEFALSYLKAGYSVVPIRPDGSKAPSAPSWKQYMKKAADEDTVRRWYQDSNSGVAIILGQVSRGLQVLDFDQPGFWERWLELVVFTDPLLITKLPHVLTPSGGHHVYYRQSAPLARKILARNAGEETAIELRGEGNYCLAPGCPPACHPSGKTYDMAQGSVPIEEAPALAPEEISVLVESARALNEWVQPNRIVGAPDTTLETPPSAVSAPEGGPEEPDLRPGDDFNMRATWPQILEPFGWVVVNRGRTEGEILWRRPGKNNGVSASTGFCKSERGGDLLYVFSTNARPFQADRAYSKFSAYATLRGGDFKAVATELAEQGFGGPPVDKIAEKLANLSFPSGPPNMAKLDVLRENDRKFNKSWMRKRTDLKNNTANEYCLSLAQLARRYGWTDQEIIDLLIAWRQKENEVEKPPEWYVRYLLKTVDQAVIMDQAADALEEGDKPDEMLENLTKFFGFRVTGFMQNCRENAVYSLLTPEGEIELGTASALLDLNQVRMILFDRKDVTLMPMTKDRWLRICANLKKVVTVKNPDEALGYEDALDWVEDHVSRRQTIASDESEEGWTVAIPRGRPFVKDGRLWINAQAVLNSIRDHADRKISRSIVLNRFRQLGFQKKVHTGLGRTRSYWGIDAERLKTLREDLWKLVFERKEVPF